MKKLICVLFVIGFFHHSFAQNTGLNFQGVARNSTGAVLSNQKINLKFSILKTTETGTIEYAEIKEATTNAQGLFSVVIGEVNAISFSEIDWKLAPKFLKVEMDPAGGNSFIAMGTSRLQNVPYAYYANGVNASNIDGTVSIAKGGTGATDASTARENLGLVIGTNVQAPLTAGTDYLTPSGNAATATKLANPRKINGLYFDGSTDITFSNIVETGNLSGTVSISKGGTGANTKEEALSNLGGESISNKSADIVADATSATKYPSVKIVKEYIDTKIASGIGTNGDFSFPRINGLKVGIGPGIKRRNYSNIAIGDSALHFNTEGFLNVAIGKEALFYNTEGRYNLAIGDGSLSFNRTGGSNIALGRALYGNYSGNENIASGVGAMHFNYSGSKNIAIGSFALTGNYAGDNNVAIGVNALDNNYDGSNNTAIGYDADVASRRISNATAIGNGAIAEDNNSIQLGNSDVISLKTSGALTTGSVTYPKEHGNSGQVLTTTGSGTLTWTTPATNNPSFVVGKNVSLGGYVIYVTPNGKHGLVVPLQDQADFNHFCDGFATQLIVSDPNNYDEYGKNFTDWRVPTKYELGLMYAKRNEIGGFLTAPQGQARGGYWSSTESYNDMMFHIFFYDNSTFTTQQKHNYLGMVRAIRSF